MDIASFIQREIIEAGTIVQELFLHATITTKGNLNNVVTEADLASENYLIEKIQQAFPGHDILGEESGATGSMDAEHLWILDPLDGTNNYAAGMPHYSISVAYAHKGVVQAGAVYDPNRKELFFAARGEGAFCNGLPISVATREELGAALICTGFYYDRGVLMEKTLDSIRTLFLTGIRGIRRTGSAALDLSWVAMGRFDGFFEYQLMPWDFAAGMLIVEEAGGLLSDIDGSPFTLMSAGVISGSPIIQKRLVELLAWHR